MHYQKLIYFSNLRIYDKCILRPDNKIDQMAKVWFLCTILKSVVSLFKLISFIEPNSLSARLSIRVVWGTIPLVAIIFAERANNI